MLKTLALKVQKKAMELQEKRWK